jgi:hypothetical protein
VAEHARWAWDMDAALRRRVREHAVALIEEKERTAAAEARAAASEAKVGLLEGHVQQLACAVQLEQGRAEVGWARVAELEGFLRAMQAQAQPKLEQQAVLELRNRCELAEGALSVYRRMVESSQDALLLLRRTGSAALDDGTGSNVGPEVVFANVTAASVLQAAPGHVVHGCAHLLCGSIDWSG